MKERLQVNQYQQFISSITFKINKAAKNFTQGDKVKRLSLINNSIIFDLIYKSKDIKEE
jgi:hypothetical protein